MAQTHPQIKGTSWQFCAANDAQFLTSATVSEIFPQPLKRLALVFGGVESSATSSEHLSEAIFEKLLNHFGS